MHLDIGDLHTFVGMIQNDMPFRAESGGGPASERS